MTRTPRAAAAGVAAAAAAAATGGAPSGSTALNKATDGGVKKTAKSKPTLAGASGGQALDPLDLERKIQQTRKQLQDTEKQIYNLESQYFENANPQGNAIRGYEGLLSSSTVNAKKAAFKPEDRIFSASSVSGL